MMRFKNNFTGNDVQPSDAASASSATFQEHVVVGFKDNSMDIKCLLLGESSKLEVVPIVGMGGIGKTTLAKNVYDDQLIIEHFDVRVWVTISQNYSEREIVSSFLASMKVFTGNGDDLIKMRLLVYRHLVGLRFLVVVDDIWSVEVWDDLKLMLPDDGKGSRIILTTRLLDVATYADSLNLTRTMHLMNKDQSWDLLRRLVFKHNPRPCKLENIGKIIARRCKGLPLAIVLISGILKNINQTEASWNIIANNMKSAIHDTNEKRVDKILSLSYTHLSRNLRLCLLFIGGFPEDYKMSVSKLIRLWIAEGFLKPSGSKSLEETGEEFLDNLVKRSLILVTKRKADGRMKELNMHDLIRDMCVRKAEQENFFHRCLGENQKILTCASAFYSSLVICKRRYLHDINRHDSLGYYRWLRILDLASLRYQDFKLSSEIVELFHLRYLAFQNFWGIPVGLSKLQNLQTLIICSFDGFECYSKTYPFIQEIWSMPQLRHLHIDYGFFFWLPSFQGGESFVLEHLHTLSVAINFVCTSKILKAVPNLKKLVTSFTGSDYEKDYQLNNLIHFQHLENLQLYIFEDFPSPDKIKPAFPCTLKKLTLYGFELSWEYLAVAGSLPKLEVLKLGRAAYIDKTWETTEGEFLHLKYLLIDGTNLKNWITESSHFPQLESLVLRRCKFLDEIPDDIGEIPTLELIEVDGRNSSLVESAKKIRENQLDYGNDSLRVHVLKGQLPNGVRPRNYLGVKWIRETIPFAFTYKDSNFLDMINWLVGSSNIDENKTEVKKRKPMSYIPWEYV